MASPARQISTDSTSDHWIPHPSVREHERQLAAASQLAREIHKLPPAQLKVAAALAGGASISAAARAAGVHRSTVHNWIRQSQRFRDLVDQSQREYVAALREQMRELEARALATVRQLLDDPETPAAVRLKAALAVLERPHFPSNEWHLPERIESDSRLYILDTLADMKVDLVEMRLNDALRRRRSAARASGGTASDAAGHDATYQDDGEQLRDDAGSERNEPNGAVCEPLWEAGGSERNEPNAAAEAAVEDPEAPFEEPVGSVASRPLAGASDAPIARNAPCPCGSGLKYKRCCGPAAPPL